MDIFTNKKALEQGLLSIGGSYFPIQEMWFLFSNSRDYNNKTTTLFSKYFYLCKNYANKFCY